MITRILSENPRIVIAQSTGDFSLARTYINELRIDVVLLDIEMQHMRGLFFFRQLMQENPVRVLVLSSLILPANLAGIEALELGAISIIHKPGGALSLETVTEALTRKIEFAAEFPLDRLLNISHQFCRSKRRQGMTHHTHISEKNSSSLIVVGGGECSVIAFEELFSQFPDDFPPVLAVIHLSGLCTASFARRIDGLCSLRVKEAVNGEKIMSGTIYLAPGGCHMHVAVSQGERMIRIFGGCRICDERSSVDGLFTSAAAVTGKQCIAVLLTGAGCDGTAGINAVHVAGGYTIVQDKRSCVLCDMPASAVSTGMVDKIVPTGAITAAIATRARHGLFTNLDQCGKVLP